MPVALTQESKYVGNDRWEWSVRLDGSPEELDSIDRVTYVLHPTFHHPVREVTDRSTKFRLDTSGWGTFTLRAKVQYKDGRELPLQHDLVLVYPNGTPTTA
jgi:transcription initiation factor IIF auxiliary subunit